MCGCGLHPVTGECSFCQAKEEMEFEVGHKLPDQMICPYCKGTGELPEWHNHITGDTEKEVCPACNGTRWCDKELAGHYNKENENKNQTP